MTTRTGTYAIGGAPTDDRLHESAVAGALRTAIERQRTAVLSAAHRRPSLHCTHGVRGTLLGLALQRSLGSLPHCRSGVSALAGEHTSEVQSARCCGLQLGTMTRCSRQSCLLSTVYCSLTTTVEPERSGPATSCVFPVGHFTVIDSACVAAPRPKYNGMTLCAR